MPHKRKTQSAICLLAAIGGALKAATGMQLAMGRQTLNRVVID